MKRLQDPHHRPGEETLGLQDRAKSPFQSDALLNRDGKMTEIRDLVSEEVKHIRVGDKFLALRRRVGDLLKEEGYGRLCPLEFSWRISFGFR